MTVSGTTGSDGDGRNDNDVVGATGGDHDLPGENPSENPPEDLDAPDGAWADGNTAGGPDAPEQLVLGEEDVRLPWLEAGEEDDFQEGSSTGQLVGLVLLGLVALGLIVGAIWWATGKKDDTVLVADGSMIEAPDQPYKEKPKDPGGKTFDGTGDTSFAVSEGQSRPVKLGQEGPPQPGFQSIGKTAAQPEAAAKGAAPADASGIGVQVGAYSTQASAEAGWTTLSQRHEALSSLKHRVVEGKADIGTVYRLQAVAADAAAARALCGQLRSAGLACQVKN